MYNSDGTTAGTSHKAARLAITYTALSRVIYLVLWCLKLLRGGWELHQIQRYLSFSLDFEGTNFAGHISTRTRYLLCRLGWFSKCFLSKVSPAMCDTFTLAIETLSKLCRRQTYLIRNYFITIYQKVVMPIPVFVIPAAGNAILERKTDILKR